ncbi:uncharacterized protein TRIADDRAFT_58132 [Trichoplax adhaerens]|uniref:Translation initiation factor eIF2B subunit beta n=1 Tax=Trichoplax adhaerens TaxID=10228 RepID=B3S0Y7_TRIAD|nr:hypothetical protein TRIADDRAFT_58132 [Trichoplax adhaerens]EDV23474.1 hypothetical protein TRIADDRAFT_58132 [Trichoplax adhaerens]|eukprot:XP_002114384.1 hypothetical protein TRIADDRAFT_58132 [Trichoplax adhaerens]
MSRNKPPLTPHLDSDAHDHMNTFLVELKHGHVSSSYHIAKRTTSLLRNMISHSRYNNAKELMELISTEGKRVTETVPSETAVGNMFKRVLRSIREEAASIQKSQEAHKNLEEDELQSTLHNLLFSAGPGHDLTAPSSQLRGRIIESIGEILTELEQSGENIAAQSLEHIHSNEVIMTIGKSKTVEAFLKGQELAKSLSKDGIDTTVITDSAIFAMMSRVNKVIIGTHTVMANGGLKAINGAYCIAGAAKHHSVPVIVCTATYKFSPNYVCSYDQHSFNKIVCPHDVMKYSEGSIVSKVHLRNPVFDYVPPELVELFITNTGGIAPSYVYRLVREMYHPDDVEL